MIIPCHPEFIDNVQVKPADIERVMDNMSKLCQSYVIVMSKSMLEKLATCLLMCKTEISGHDMLKDIDVTSYRHKKRKYLDKLVEMGLIEMTKPDKPTARDQRYIHTTLGKKIIEE